MRIVSGKWGGRKLTAFASDAIRPTTDRVKETIFNMIGPDIIDSKILDLFTGTGSLSFESLSRGAEVVVAVDSGQDSKDIFEKNRKILQVGNEELIYKDQDIFSFLKGLEESFDYILIDPPFTKKMGAKVLRAVADSAALKPHTRIFIECVKGEETVDEYGSLTVDKVKNYGDKLLYTYTVKD